MVIVKIPESKRRTARLHRRLCIALILLCCGFAATAQERLTLDDAITKALAHNFDIRVAKNVADVAAQNNTLGNAGLFPTISINGGGNTGALNTRQELATGAITERSGARSTSYTAEAAVDWAVFAAGRVWLSKKQLAAQERLGNFQYRAQVQTTVSQVIREYAQIVFRNEQRIAVDTGLALAKVRMQLSLAKFESGLSAKTDFLQARVDYNARQSDSLNQEAQLAAGFGNLNVLMGEADVDKTWIVDDTLIADAAMEPADKELLQNNFSIRAARQSLESARLEAKIQRTFLLPTLGVTGAYTYTRVQNQVGFALFNRSYGPNVGASVNFPIFQGGNLRRQYRVATLQALQEELRYARTTTDFARQYRTAWSNYQMSVAAFSLEQQNIGFAFENLNIQRARFRVGVATTLETREAENSYVQALVRLYTAGYNLKVTETQVLELENKLVETGE